MDPREDFDRNKTNIQISLAGTVVEGAGDEAEARQVAH